ncbi:hypothetical protein [Tardiphaga sp. OK245]|uniref:DUF6894 family protein n=1 Tax=Tardiphaga sp. OK245 TaxID=1855306 RepID=UPI00147BD150|nr:hypothetical protein [Tardiphaga sp. OK245]
MTGYRMCQRLTNYSLGHAALPNYWSAMRYFFHILDGPKVFSDEVGSRLSNPKLAITQAQALATELGKAGALCRSSLVFVLDENGNRIFPMPGQLTASYIAAVA